MHAAEPQLETAAAIEAQIAAQVAADLNLALTLTLTLTLTLALTPRQASSRRAPMSMRVLTPSVELAGTPDTAGLELLDTLQARLHRVRARLRVRIRVR